MPTLETGLEPDEPTAEEIKAYQQRRADLCAAGRDQRYAVVDDLREPIQVWDEAACHADLGSVPPPRSRSTRKRGARLRRRSLSSSDGRLETQPTVDAAITPEEAEILRRSIAMLPPQSPSGLTRERALAILGSSCGR